MVKEYYFRLVRHMRIWRLKYRDKLKSERHKRKKKKSVFRITRKRSTSVAINDDGNSITIRKLIEFYIFRRNEEIFIDPYNTIMKAAVAVHRYCAVRS